MQTRSSDLVTLPDPPLLRAWLLANLNRLGVSGSALSIRAGLRRNHAGDFIAGRSASIQLAAAADLVAALRAIAAEQGCELVPLAACRGAP